MTIAREIYKIDANPGRNPSDAAARMAMYVVGRWMSSCQGDHHKAFLLAKPLATMLLPIFQRPTRTVLEIDTRGDRPLVREVTK